MSDSGFSVLVFDMAHRGEPDGERRIDGFANAEAARAYAEARVRSSVEELRKPGQSADELRSLWYLYGEDCSVIGDSFKGHEAIDRYVAHPATPDQTDWPALAPQAYPRGLRRFHATVMFAAGDPTDPQNWAAAGGFLTHPERPTRNELFDLYVEDGKATFVRRGLPDALPKTVDIAHLFELADAPVPPADGRTRRNWRVSIDFVCHDVKFGGSASGVFSWPEKPDGEPLRRMQRLLMGDMLAVRGDGPDYADYSDVVRSTVEETDEAPDYP